MAISKAGLRKIIVNKVEYLWKFKKRKDYCPCCLQGKITIVILKKGENKPLLINILDEIEPENYSITPNTIKTLIDYYLKEGWNPKSNSVFEVSFLNFKELFFNIDIFMNSNFLKKNDIEIKYLKIY